MKIAEVIWENPLTPWDPVGLPLDPLRPRIGIKDQLADLSRPICPCFDCFTRAFKLLKCVSQNPLELRMRFIAIEKNQQAEIGE